MSVHPSNFRKPLGQDWLDQIFRAQAVAKGGVVYRNLRDVEREIGLERLELEVRRRGFRMALCGHHVIVSCSPTPITVLC